MNFLTPLAFGLAALLPVIVALYLLKLRREEYRVSSTYLWRTMVRDTAANAPWQRLRPNLLLLVQLLFLAALILALARPFVWSESAAGSHLILVIDTSASMGATDVKPNRLGAALASARRLIESLPASARVTMIEAGSQVRVPVSGASGGAAALAALTTLRAGLSGADFGSALTLASAIAAREPDSEVVILSDGHVTLPEQLTLPGRVRYIPIGQDSENQAIGAFSIETDSAGRNSSIFVQAINYGTQTAQRRLVVYADGQLLAARDVTLLPGKPQPISIPVPISNTQVIEASLEGQDALTADDHAWAAPPSGDKIAINLIGPGNRFLEIAIGLMSNVELPVTSSISYPVNQPASSQQPVTSNEKQVTSLTIFDSLIPTGTLPGGNLIFIAPPRSTELFSVTGRIDAPAPAPLMANDPLLSNLDPLDVRQVAVQSAARIPLPAWGRAALIDGKTGAPLLIIGEQGGRRLAVLAFDLRKSDLPLRVAFPILMANLIDALAPGGAGGIPADVEPGRPVVIPAPLQARAIAIRAPDGREYTLSPSEGRVLFEQTNQVGVYQAAWQDDASQSHAMGRFAVNLFNAGESDIAPRQTLPLSGASSAAQDALPRARDEQWRLEAWAALALLVVEWLLSHRGQLTRLFGMVNG